MSFHLIRYSIMSGCGFGVDGKCGFSTDFIMAWIGLAVLVLVFMIAKKWLGEEEIVGYSYHWLASLMGILIYILIVSIFGNYKISLIVGLITMFAAGFAGGSLFGTGGE